MWTDLPLSPDREAALWNGTRAKRKHHLLFFTSPHHSLMWPWAAPAPAKHPGTRQGWLHVMTEGHWQSAGKSLYKPARYLLSCFIGAFGPFFRKDFIRPQFIAWVWACRSSEHSFLKQLMRIFKHSLTSHESMSVCTLMCASTHAAQKRGPILPSEVSPAKYLPQDVN